MTLEISKRTNTEVFVIEDNIIKAVEEDFDVTHSIGEYLFDTLSSKPDHVAQIEAETGKQTTFAEMKDCSVRCGIWLKQQGIGPNDIVVICSKNHLNIYAPVFGTFYIGGTFVGWNPFTIALKPVQRNMKLFKPKIIFADEEVIDTLREAAKLENIDTKFVVFGKHTNLKSFDDIVNLSTEKDVHSFRPEKVNPRNNAAIVLTSGSTGFPKGVVHTYEGVLKFAILYTRKSSYRCVAMWYSACDSLTNLVYTLTLVSSLNTRIIHAKFESEDTCRVIEKYEVNRIFLPYMALNHMVKTHTLTRYNLQSLNFVCTSGSKVSSHVLQAFRDALPNALVVQLYGMTEIGCCVASQTETSKSIDSVGFLRSCNQLKIIDINTGKILGINQSGEICVKSQIMMSGYFNDPEATKEVLDHEGWLRTGDKGFYNENYELFIIERIKEMMKYRTHKISPCEIEEALLSHPEVVDVAVVPLPHPEDIDRPMAFVKRIPGSQVTEDELVKLSASVMGDLKKLHGGVKFLDDIPKTSNGKNNRLLLKEMAKAIALEQ